MPRRQPRLLRRNSVTSRYLIGSCTLGSEVSTIATASAAQSLAGMRLDRGWTVTELVPRRDRGTGGRYSVSYLAVHDSGARGFLKALDYSRAFTAPDRVLELNRLTSAYLHEVRLLYRCAAKRLRRIVRAIDKGQVSVPGFQIGVDYIIFERAERDLREQIDIVEQIDDAWRLRTLHQIATGLFELHGSGIAHQDLKPSNVLQFSREDSRLADLGTSACRDMEGPYDNDTVPGTRAYAPPELLYSSAADNWDRRRFGCDAYLLGSMIVYLFTGCNATALLINNLAKEHRHDQWGDGFLSVLPYLRASFGAVLAQLTATFTVPLVSQELLTFVSELCEPDPTKRGHPANRNNKNNQYSLERYVSRFDNMAKRLEYSIFRTN